MFKPDTRVLLTDGHLVTLQRVVHSLQFVCLLLVVKGEVRQVSLSHSCSHHLDKSFHRTERLGVKEKDIFYMQLNMMF